jgi:hypothetical protein
MPGIREVLAFSRWDGTEVLEHFIREFYPWELICEKERQKDTEFAQ